jgi:hypothetical protein
MRIDQLEDRILNHAYELYDEAAETCGSARTLRPCGLVSPD